MNAGLTNNIAQGQAQRDVGVDDRAEQQRPSTEIDCHGGPVPEVSRPPEATAPLARGGSLYRHATSDGCNHLAGGTLPPPTAVISDSAFKEWLQSDDMKMSMFSLSEEPQQSAPTVVALAAAAPARVFQRLGGTGIRRFRPRGDHQNNPFRGQHYMIFYMIGKLAPNSTYFTRGLVK